MGDKEETDAKPTGAGWFSDLFSSNNSSQDKSNPGTPDNDGFPMPCEKDALEYNMEHPRRGKAIIFNNKYFERQKLPARNGTDVDRDNLDHTLTNLGFEVHIYNDPTCSQIQSIIHELAVEDHTDHDCLLVAVFSHGEPNLIHANDFTYKPEILWEPFAADRCQSLAGKPKIFLIQACQGDQFDHGTKLITNEKLEKLRKRSESGVTMPDSPPDKTYRIPNRADFLMVFSTVPGFYSWRNSGQGSWFIQAFNKIFRKYGHTKEILSLITHVTREVAVNFESFSDKPRMDRKKQVPFLTSTLTREVYFIPKNYTSQINNIHRETHL